ncbi:MAG: hypothetical protein ABFC80_08335, partial [Coriobacteriales bacterium]
MYRHMACFGIVALAVLVLWALMASPASALTNDGATLDIGSGESLTLDGIHEYTSSISIHDGGVLYVGASRTLTLRAPSITISGEGCINGAGGASAAGGATVVLDCATLAINGPGGITARGRDGFYAGSPVTVHGGAGGSIEIRAATHATLSGGFLNAAGGNGYGDASRSGAGGNGGTVIVRSAVLDRADAAGTAIDVSGGD